MSRHAVGCTTVIALTMFTGGCYQRTVSTSGIGTRGVTTQESYRSNTAADRWVDETFLGRREPPQPGWKRVTQPPGR